MNVSDIKLRFPIIFHLILWSIWIGLPIINAGDHQHWRLYMIWIIPISLTQIPLFLFNTEWLIPKVLRQQGVSQYLLSLILLVAGFATLQFFMKEWIIPDEVLGRRNSIFMAVIPPLFVTAISTGYGFMVYLLKQEKAAQEVQQEQLKSELSFLRSQISPHFIFNILNSIVYLIRTQSPQAEPVTHKLSELMRYMLYTSSDEQVSLEQEIAYLENYIELQRIRFEEDVDIQLTLKGNAGTQPIEPMILIPFVENAFKHGVGLVEKPVIEVKLVLKEKNMKFQVRNKIASVETEDKDISSGIGLKNVRRRLELQYPQTHTLTIDESKDWFEVELMLNFSSRNKNSSNANSTLTHETQMHSG